MEAITFRALLIQIVTAAAVIQVATSATYTVGGPNGGWDLGTNLQQWASAQEFVPGDRLAFSYAPSHDVVEVTKAEYDSCAVSNPIQSYTGGSTTVVLSAPGKRYFICGIPGHCAGGMKLQVDVASAAVTSSPPADSAPVPKPGTSDQAQTPPSELAPWASSEEPVARSLGVPPASPPTMQSAAADSSAFGCGGLANLAMGLALTVMAVN